MLDERTIPVVIGVTGHRVIRPEDWDALYIAVKAELEKLQKLCPHSPLKMLSSLAEGADQLCADAALALGIGVTAVLPVEAEIYEKDFSPAALRHFRELCEAAEQVFVAPFTEPPVPGPDRDFRFRQAGIYVVAHSHVLLALWDGGEGKNGCGTADVVGFSLHGSYSPAYGVPLRSDSKEAVIHVFTPRSEHTEEDAGTVHILGNWEAVQQGLLITDEFNRETAALPESRRHILPEDHGEDAVLSRMERVYLSASAISTAAAKTYRRILAALAITSTIITLAFLLYDEAETIWMIYLCGIMVLADWLCQKYAQKTDCHRKYIECRALAECLRVQAFLSYAGSGVQASDLLTWTQQEETSWIRDALCVLTVGSHGGERHDILSCWVEDQENYHRKAQKKSLRSSVGSGRVVGTALVLSVTLYFAALLFEIFCGGELGVKPIAAVGNVEAYRTWLKIVLGGISAVTLFIANYYGKLSLSRQLSDHEKMAHFYHEVAEQLRSRGQTDALMTVLGREELIENGNWCSYQRDNTPDFSL